MDNFENIIPETLEECYNELEQMKNVEDWLKSNEYDATAQAHHTVGRYIRNNWKLWEGNTKLTKWFNENGINHPDDMSNIILTSFYRYKKNIDINLEEQFDNTINYYLDDRQKLIRKRKQKLNKINNES